MPQYLALQRKFSIMKAEILLLRILRFYLFRITYMVLIKIYFGFKFFHMRSALS